MSFPNPAGTDAATSPNPYHRIENLPDRTELYPTERLFRKCIAVTWMFCLMVLLPFGVVTASLLIAGIALPNFEVAAFISLAILFPVVALTLWIRAMDTRARQGCAIPLVIDHSGPDRQVSYRGARIASSSEMVGIRIVRIIFDDHPDLYSVGFESPSGKVTGLPAVLPVTWWFGTGQGYFGSWADKDVAERLVQDLSRILSKPLLGEVEVRRD